MGTDLDENITVCRYHTDSKNVSCILHLDNFESGLLHQYLRHNKPVFPSSKKLGYKGEFSAPKWLW